MSSTLTSEIRAPPSRKPASQNTSTETPQQRTVRHFDSTGSLETMPKVTPAEQVPLESSDNKQVRFINKDQDFPSNKTQLRAAGVSKRGRYVSPGHRIGTSSMQRSVLQSPAPTQSDRVNGGVVEYRTYRSPDTSTVPSLCSAPSDQDGDSKIAARENQPPSSPTQEQSKHLDSEGIKSPTGLFFLSPKERFDSGDRFMATPTDFTVDYHKTPNGPHTSFDTSHVLAWLQSPTANGLFSPGFGSILNTPNCSTKQTPSRTPTVSTSFFFSDVASLPKHNGEPQTPKDNGESMSSVICISPLASKKSIHSHQTPVDLNEIFASPRERKYRSAMKSDPSVDAIVAERDLMEDEDLSVLLQLASNSTPRGGSLVFRSPRKTSGKDDVSKELPALQLPMIGGKDAGPKARLEARKSRSTEDFVPPQLEMRSNTSSSATKEILARGSKNDDKDNNKKGLVTQNDPLYEPPYGFPIPPPGMPTGSMRVSIGGPPPKKGSSTSSPHHFDFSGMPSYAPQPGMFPSYGGPVMGYPSYFPPPPPPRPLSVFAAAQKSDPEKNADENKRKNLKKPASSPTDSKSKKKKKLSPSQPRKKNKSPQITEKSERDKAAAAIQDLNTASGGKNDKAAALAAAILRGVTMRPSGKWQAQLYFAGKSRYIGVFDTREKAALAYEIAREKLKSGNVAGADGETIENLVNVARKAAFDGVSEQLRFRQLAMAISIVRTDIM